MENNSSFMKEVHAEQEMEELLADPELSAEEKALVEEQLRNIRSQYSKMIEDLYA